MVYHKHGRRSREFAAILRARSRAQAQRRPWLVYVGFVRVEGRLGKLHLRSAYEPAPRGAVRLAWCSVNGHVRLTPTGRLPGLEWFNVLSEELRNHELSESAGA